MTTFRLEVADGNPRILGNGSPDHGNTSLLGGNRVEYFLSSGEQPFLSAGGSDWDLRGPKSSSAAFICRMRRRRFASREQKSRSWEL